METLYLANTKKWVVSLPQEKSEKVVVIEKVDFWVKRRRKKEEKECLLLSRIKLESSKFNFFVHSTVFSTFTYFSIFAQSKFGKTLRLET